MPVMLRSEIYVSRIDSDPQDLRMTWVIKKLKSR